MLFISQESYKSEGIEKALSENSIPFKQFEKYHLTPNQIMKKEHVSLLIVGNDTDVIPQWFINSTHNMSIKSILIQDGLFFNLVKHKQSFFTKYFHVLQNTSPKLLLLTLRLLLFKKYLRVKDGHSQCTQICVWGKKSKKYFLDSGINETKIKLIGNILPNSFLTQSIPSSDSFLILYTPSDLIKSHIFSKHDIEHYTEIILQTISKIPNVKLFVKPHPSESYDFYKCACAKYNNVTLYSDDIHVLLPKANLIIGDISTLIIESLRLQKPVIIFLPNIDSVIQNGDFPKDLIEKKLVLYAHDEFTLNTNIINVQKNNLILDLNLLNEVLIDYFGPMDNQELARLMQHIDELIYE